MADVESYSVTAASNTGEFPEGQAPSTVNDGGRQVQADVKIAHNRINGDITAGGTADALTAAFTPAHTAHVAGRVLVITAASANATTTPTFTPDALSSKTITKNGGQALVAGDIYGAGHELILKDAGTYFELMNPAMPAGVTSTVAELNILDGVTATAAEINELDESARTVSGYVSGVATHIESDVGAASTAFDIATNIGAAWESVGPTGSGATNIWTALDDVPVGAKYVIIKFCGTWSSGSTNRISARVTGSSTAEGNQTRRINLASSAAIYTTSEVPTDSSGRFDIYGSTTTDTAEMYLVGWGI